MLLRSPFGSTPRSRVALAAVALGALAIVAVPRKPPTVLELEAQRQEHQLRLAHAELFGAIEEYRIDHGSWPGIAPEGGHDRPHGARWLREQLLGITDARGRVGGHAESDARAADTARDRKRHPFGPYVRAIPPNPVDGSALLHVVGRDADGPTTARGAGGWLFDPRTGTLRSNAAGAEASDA